MLTPGTEATVGCVEPELVPAAVAHAPLDAALAVVGGRPEPAGRAARRRRRPAARLSAARGAIRVRAQARGLPNLLAWRAGRPRDAGPADDALVAVLRKLPTFRGASRFTTWAAKFAILEASVKARRRAWQDRELTLEPEAWERFGGTGSASAGLEHSEQLEAIGDGHPHWR